MASQKQFAIPQMSNYDAKKDLQDNKELTEQEKIEREVEEMGFEAIKGEEDYVSPEEASPEALKRIKARKIGGFINTILGKVGDSVLED
jgi:hypothetical protein